LVIEFANRGEDSSMKRTRRDFLQASATGIAAAFVRSSSSSVESTQQQARRFHFVQIDVFTSQRLQGNALAVFPDARGLTDSELQDIARETNLQETTFVFPRDPATEFHGSPPLYSAVPLGSQLATIPPTLDVRAAVRIRG